MCEIKWIKLSAGIFDDQIIRLITSMPEGDAICLIWIQLLVEAGKTNSNGSVFMREGVPYSNEMLATIFSKSVDKIKLALKTLDSFGLISVDEDNLIKITNWEKHQNIQGMEMAKEKSRQRMQKSRNKKNSEDVTELDLNLGKNTDTIIKEDFCLNLDLGLNKELDVNTNMNINSSLVNNIEENTSDVKQDSTSIKYVAEDVSHKNITVAEQSATVTKDISHNNITVAQQGATVTLQREIENKKEIENKIEKIESETTKNTKSMGGFDSKAIELALYFESITGLIGVVTHNHIKSAIVKHGDVYVKQAIDKAFEVDRCNIGYINGILRNWRLEGYPKEGEVNTSGNHNRGPARKKLEGFKPHTPTKLSAAEQAEVEKELI